VRVVGRHFERIERKISRGSLVVTVWVGHVIVYGEVSWLTATHHGRKGKESEMIVLPESHERRDT
jgi:hypothetical protein